MKNLWTNRNNSSIINIDKEKQIIPSLCAGGNKNFIYEVQIRKDGTSQNSIMKGKLNIMSEKKSVAATVLTYTEKELAAIKALEANKGERLSSAELGISGITLVGLRKKAEKVEKGVLANPEGLPVLHIVKDKVEREFKEVKSCTVYGIK